MLMSFLALRALFEAQYLTHTYPCQRLPTSVTLRGHDSGTRQLAYLTLYGIFSHTNMPGYPGASPISAPAVLRECYFATSFLRSVLATAT
jgi:hypothetical protein